MPGTNVPAQMFNHELNVVKGWPSPYAMDKVKGIDPAETLVILAGRVIFTTPNDLFAMGCPYNTGDALAPMPLFAWPSSSDFDVSSDVGNTNSGHMMGLPAIGPYEFETTEFKGGGFIPNAPLVSDFGGVVAADRGKVKVGSLNTAALAVNEHLVLGVVSDAGPLVNSNRKDVVRFWPVYLPVRV